MDNAELLAALERNTQALNANTASNVQLIAALQDAGDDGSELPASVALLLDGSPAEG